MRHGDRIVAAAEMLREPLDDVRRAMTTARAADGDGEIRHVLRRDLRQPRIEELADVAEHALDVGVLLEIRDDFRIEPGLRPQVLFPMWIRQAAHVEQEVDAFRRAVLEAERDEGDTELAALGGGLALADRLAQLMEVELAGVEDEVGGLRDRQQKLPLPRDRFLERDLRPRERMLAPGLRVALQDHGVAGGEED